MTITLRNTKGQALTFNELDGNFTDLDSRILSQAQIEGFIDSSYIKGFIDSSYLSSAAATRFLDSADAISLIDSAYVAARTPEIDSAYIQARQSLVDSASIISLIDSSYIIQRAGVTTDSAAILAMIDSSYIQSQMNAFAFDIFHYETTAPQSGFSGVDKYGNTLTYNPNRVSVYLNGVLLTPDDFVTSNAGNSITLNTSTDSDDIVSVIAINGGGLAFDSVTTANLIDSNYIQQRTRIGLNDIDFGSNKITYSNVYSNLVDLPSAASYHGMFAHVHATGKGYFAHGGNWIELANQADIGTTITSTVDSAYVTALIDSHVTNLIDSNYVSGRSGGGGGGVEFFTATGSTVKNGDGNVIVHLAGGGGGASATHGGDGGNSYGTALFTNLTDGTTITITQIGAGGTSASNGSAGGTTTVTAGSQTISMSGGGGGVSNTYGGVAYVPSVSGGAIAFRGITGTPSGSFATITLFGHANRPGTYGTGSRSGYGAGGIGGQYQGSKTVGKDGCVLLIGV